MAVELCSADVVFILGTQYLYLAYGVRYAVSVLVIGGVTTRPRPLGWTLSLLSVSVCDLFYTSLLKDFLFQIVRCLGQSGCDERSLPEDPQLHERYPTCNNIYILETIPANFFTFLQIVRGFG